MRDKIRRSEQDNTFRFPDDLIQLSLCDISTMNTGMKLFNSALECLFTWQCNVARHVFW